MNFKFYTGIRESRIYKKFKLLFSSKSFLASLLFASALWMYTSLNEEYVTFVDIPLSIQLPETRAITSRVRSNISLKVRGSGWQLFYLYSMNTAAQCKVDLTEGSLIHDLHNISRDEILKSSKHLMSVEPIDVVPKSVNIQTDLVETKRVPLESVLQINPKSGFTEVNRVKLIPDSVDISGSRKLLSKIELWKTAPVSYDDMIRSQVITVPLSDSMSNRIKLSVLEVKARIDIQQTAERTFHDIPLKVKGGSMSKAHQISPMLIDVTLQGGVKDLAVLSPKMIKSHLLFSAIYYDTTGYIEPHIEFPGKFKLLNKAPNYISHRVRVKSLTD
ncbi:MAG: hypothetical protein PF588_11015 [Candidatus Kapabacteria bacterium]|jgi:hypothetical protein|nr:hypothetical protein [Candidatus Kapabacteria bacterium]